MTAEPADRQGSDRPDSSSSGSETLATVLESYLADLDAGRAQTPEELYAAHPAIADQLRDCLQAIEFVHGARQRLEGLPGAAAQLDDFRIVREIGSGGMGVVYEAEQVSLGRRVALKVLRFGPSGDAEATRRFRREAEIIARLHHTNIVPVYAVGQASGVHYFAMQFIDGQSLAELAGEDGRVLTLDEVTGIGLDAAEALAHAHDRNVIHRDVKPSNLLIDADQRVWLTDFGLARHDDDRTLSLSGALLGTPRYMSPEQAAAEGHVDHRADVYGLGATLYELASGRPLFEAKTPHEVIQRILTDEPVPLRRVNAEMPQDFETIVMKCLAKEPGRRYATAGELAGDLRSFQQGRSISARRPSLIQRAVRASRRHRKSFAIAVASATLAVFASLLAIAGMQQAHEADTGRLAIDTSDLGARIEILDDKGRQAVPASRTPFDAPLVLEAGAYRLRGSFGDLPSQTFLFDVVPGDHLDHALNLRERLLWPPFEARHDDRLQAVTLSLANHDDLLLWDSTGLRRVDGPTRATVWQIERPASSRDEVSLDHDYQSASLLAGRPRASRVVSDLDGDDVPDLLVGLRRNTFCMAVSGQDGRPLWRTSPDDGRRLVDAISPADLDGDGKADVLAVVATGDGGLAIEAIVGATGRALWRAPLSADAGQVLGPFDARIGAADAVVVASPDRIVALRAADGEVVAEPIDLASDLVRNLQVVDVDGDGDSELLVLTAPTDGDESEALTLRAYDFGSREPSWMQSIAASWPDADKEADDGAASPADWPLVADLDGDGRCEVAVPTRRVAANEAGYALQLLDGATGQPRWVRFWFDAAGRALLRASLGAELSRSMSDALRGEAGGFGALVGMVFGGRASREQIDRLVAGPDVDGDGHGELFCANLDGSSLYVTALSGSDGRTLWWWRQPRVDGGRIAPLVFWEHGSDGLPLLLVSYQQSQGGMTHRDGVKVVKSPSRVFALSASRGELQDIMHGAPRLRLADLNGDDLPDLLARQERDNPSRSDIAVTASIDAIAGRPPRSFRRLGMFRAAADLDGDDIDDLVGEGMAVSGSDGALIWRHKDATGRCLAPAPLGDLDGDGVADLIDGSAPDVEVFSGRDGRPLYTVEVSAMVPEEDADLPMKGASRGSGDPPATLCDLDGDGRAEILHFFTRTFGESWDNRTREPRLAAIVGAAGKVMWSVPIGSGGHRPRAALPLCGDVDGDGQPEVVLVTIDEEEVWQLRLLDGRDGSLRWSRPLSKRNYDIDDCPVTVRLADLDADGVAEIVTIDRLVELAAPLVKKRGSSRPIKVTAAQFRVQAWDGRSGEERWTWLGTRAGEHSISDGDPSWRVRAVVTDVHPHGPCICAQLVYEGHYEGGSGPLPGKSYQEVLRTLVLDGRGQPLHLSGPIEVGRSLHNLDGANACDIAVCDLDGDGSNEVLWTSERGVVCTSGLPNDVRWAWAPDGNVRIGAFDGRPRPAVGVQRVAVGGEPLLAVPVSRTLREPRFSRKVRHLVLLDLEGTPRFDLAGRELLTAPGLSRPRTVQYHNGSTSCWLGAAVGPSAGATSIVPQPDPDPRYARSLPWYRRGELRFFWGNVVDSLALMLVPLALLWWAWRWRSWAVAGLFVCYGAIVAGGFALDQLPMSKHLGSIRALEYAVDLGQRVPLVTWLSIGPVHLGRVLLGLPLIVVAGAVLWWLVRRRWQRLIVLLVVTAALSAGLVTYYLDADAGRRSPLEHYVFTDSWWIVMHAAYLAGLLLLAIGAGLALRRGWRRFQPGPSLGGA